MAAEEEEEAAAAATAAEEDTEEEDAEGLPAKICPTGTFLDEADAEVVPGRGSVGGVGTRVVGEVGGAGGGGMPTKPPEDTRNAVSGTSSLINSWARCMCSANDATVCMLTNSE